jgi:hypothetical protein
VIYSSGFQSRSREAQVKSIQPDIDVKDDDDDDDDLRACNTEFVPLKQERLIMRSGENGKERMGYYS